MFRVKSLWPLPQQQGMKVFLTLWTCNDFGFRMKTWLHIKGTFIKIVFIFITTLVTCVVSTSNLQFTFPIMPIPVFESLSLSLSPSLSLSLSLSLCGQQKCYKMLHTTNSVFPKLIGHGTFSLSKHIFAESIIEFLYLNLRY
jgi:hypothetical protein